MQWIEKILKPIFEKKQVATTANLPSFIFNNLNIIM